ncbi:MAG: RNA polymerase sigma factor [Terriglobales bacterium]
MASTFHNISILPAFLTSSSETGARACEEIYQRNRHRIYALAFLMTDNELMAEELMQISFRTAFSKSAAPSAETIDRALVAAVRNLMPLGTLTLACSPSTRVANVRRNTLRVHLEQAVVQVPPTERMIFLMHDVEGYDHARIGRCLGLAEDESKQGLHQARLRIRELLAAMKS